MHLPAQYRAAPSDDEEVEDEDTGDEVPTKMANTASGRAARIDAAEAAAAVTAARFVLETAEGSRDGQLSRGVQMRLPPQSRGVPPESGGGASAHTRQRQQSSRYLGVSWHKAGSSFQVQLYDEQTKRPQHIGSYASEEDAARAYDRAAVQAHGPGAKRNFPGEALSEPTVTAGEEQKQRGSSRYTGVTWCQDRSSWKVQLYDEQTKRQQHVGYFSSEEDAARAYDRAAVQAHGPGAKRNFPDEAIGELPVTVSVGRKKRRSFSSRYFGVSWNTATSSWRVQLMDPQTKRKQHIGTFASEEDAARAYDRAAVQARGPGAECNFTGEAISEPPVAVGEQRTFFFFFFGVSWNKSMLSWRAELWDPRTKRNQYIGCYVSEQDAARAYDCAALHVGGSGAKRNFPDEVPESGGRAHKKKRGSSRYFGVCWDKVSSSWRVQLTDPQTKRKQSIGSYASEEDAARAYDCAAVHVPGAKRNFPAEAISEPPVAVGVKRKQHSSRFIGVHWEKSRSSWRVQLTDSQTKRKQSIGSYASEEDAARAYDCAAVHTHGPEAKRNFPDEAIGELP
jgi:hypothetical protein